MKYILIIVGLVLAQNISFGQGLNHQWLLGSYNFIQDPKGRILFDQNSYTLMNENRKMPFKGTQGNISDKNGNLLMSSNGFWIANALNDTMVNGSGINPNGITSSWPYGLPMIANNVFLPYPDDSSKYILLHHTTSNPPNSKCYELYSSIINITLDNGLGEVISKNNIVYQDTLNSGIGACRHANGRDWWIVMIKDSTDIIVKFLLTPSGITNISTQIMGYFPFSRGGVAQLTFSPDGTKFITTTYDNNNDKNSSIVISDFDRCTGVFSNTQTIQLISGAYLWGLSFSPSGNYAYACSDYKIFQVDTDSLTVVTVATYDGFVSPGPTCCNTSFWNMYLAANGKIYVTSGSGVQHLHEINYPDSAGLACDVQQHAISLGYAQLRAVPNHPNYYLGCDTTLGCPCLIPPTGIDEYSNEFNLNIFPNPTTNKQFNISYLLPQNKNGVAEIFDINGKLVYTKVLPPWSTLQQFNLSHLSEGIYAVKITSDGSSVVKKVVLRE